MRDEIYLSQAAQKLPTPRKCLLSGTFLIFRSKPRTGRFSAQQSAKNVQADKSQSAYTLRFQYNISSLKNQFISQNSFRKMRDELFNYLLDKPIACCRIES